MIKLLKADYEQSLIPGHLPEQAGAYKSKYNCTVGIVAVRSCSSNAESLDSGTEQKILRNIDEVSNVALIAALLQRHGVDQGMWSAQQQHQEGEYGKAV